ncbi:killer cell lectin-like receptor subfamily F member 1 isoform X1 [Ornithorhynchus anatinus]|uniref:killer cell lectin-like receptor subfamily F member 1 isoform X1 n=1 Tax=Ornithorhynchus anatinus TaxID=9258 RepID=UPI0010A8F490|nr:killer cell lectin-like receptor subfamily F member 1 isoform X1 [Ornithorhynchus anatinus]
MEREGIAIMDKEISSEGAQNRPTPAMRTALRKNITISSSPQKNSEQGHRSRCSCCYIVTIILLGIAVLALLGTVLYLILKRHESSCEENMVLKVENSTRLVTLKEDLCPEQNGTVCELCPPGWRLSNSKCYYFSGEKQSWEASARNCANRKSRLLVLEDEAEAVRVQEMRPRDEYFWIGYKYNTTQGQWMWLDDPGFSRYRVSAKYLSQLECVSFKGKNSFAPEKCSQLHYCVCKKNVTVLEP